MSSFRKFLKYIDQFGSPIQLNYKKEYTLKTQLGGVVTIIAGILLVVLSYIFAREFFVKDNPTVTYSKVIRNQSEVYLRDFPLAFTFSTKTGGFKHDSLLSIDAYQFLIWETNGTADAKMDFNFSLVSCTKEMFGRYGDAAEQAAIIGSVCLTHGENASFINDYSIMNSSLLNIRFNVCNNKTRKAGNWCASPEKIQSTLTEFYVSLFLPDYLIEPDKYANPERPYIFQHSQRASINFYRRNIIRIITTEIKTDNGWFQEDLDSYSISTYDSIKFDMDLSSSTSPDLKYQLSFESPKLGDVYVRKYPKIQIILANIGGMMNIIIIICKLVCQKVSELSFFFQKSKDLVNFVSEYDEEKPEKLVDTSNNESRSVVTIIPFKKKEEIELSITNPNPVLVVKANTQSNYNLVKDKVILTQNSLVSKNYKKMDDPTKLSYINDEEMKKIRAFAKENKNQLGFIDYLKRVLSCNKENDSKKKLYEAIKTYFMDKVDISSLIKLNRDFELLKFIVLGNKEGEEDIFKIKCSIDDILIHYKKDIEDAKSEDIENGIEKNQIDLQAALRKSLYTIKDNFDNKMDS